MILQRMHLLSVPLKASPPVSVHVNFILQLNSPASVNTSSEMHPCEAQLDQKGWDIEGGGSDSF